MQLSPRPPPKISLRHDHDWTGGNDELESTVEQQPVGELVQLFFLEKHHVLNSPIQPNPNPNQSVIDRGNLRTQNMFLLTKVKRHVPTRLMKSVCTKNLVLQIDRRNLRDCLKTFVFSMLTMEQGNLWSQAARVHTQ